MHQFSTRAKMTAVARPGGFSSRTCLERSLKTNDYGANMNMTLDGSSLLGMPLFNV